MSQSHLKGFHLAEGKSPVYQFLLTSLILGGAVEPDNVILGVTFSLDP